jgi:hypothetical protein
MRFHLAVLAICLLVFQTGAATAQSWVAGGDSLWHIDATSPLVLNTYAVRRLDAMTSDGAGGIWYSTEEEILRRDSAGAQVLQVNARRVGLNQKIAWLAGDPYAQTAWASDGARLVALNGTGHVEVDRALSVAPVRMAVAQDQHLWVLEKHRLLRLGKDGVTVSSFDLRTSLQAEARHLVLDDFAGQAWVVGERRAVSLGHSGVVLGRFSLSEPSRGACMVPGSDALWVLTSAAMEARAPGGQLLKRILLNGLGIPRASVLACHWERQEIWIAHDRGILRLDLSGNSLGTVNLQTPTRMEALAFSVRPRVELRRPPDDALTVDRLPVIELSYATACVRTQCPTPASYLERATLLAELDGEQVGGRFAFDRAERRASYQPVAPLSQGEHRLLAKLQDQFGHRSNILDARFTVDTVAPEFVSISPADGTLHGAAQIVISGEVNDPEARVVLADAQSLGGVEMPAAPGQFAFSVPLQPGANSFTLSAIDRAGNVATRTLRLTRVIEALAATLLAPADGASVNADSVIVRGTVEAGGTRVGVSINGEPASLIGNAFYAQVPLDPGANLLTVRLTAPDGRVSTRSVTVTRSGIRSFRAHAVPSSGIAPSEVRFQASATAERSIARVQVDYQGDGSLDASTTNPAADLRHTYAVPGVYNARVVVTDPFGYQEIHIVQIVVQDLAAVDRELKGIVQTMLTSLRAGDLDTAVRAFAPSNQPRFRSLFESARSNLAAAVDSLGVLQDGSITGSMAEYVMVQDHPAGPKAYFIYLMRARDGLWQIQQM